MNVELWQFHQTKDTNHRRDYMRITNGFYAGWEVRKTLQNSPESFSIMLSLVIRLDKAIYSDLLENNCRNFVQNL
jgi:hypothetical protein